MKMDASLKALSSWIHNTSITITFMSACKICDHKHEIGVAFQQLLSTIDAHKALAHWAVRLGMCLYTCSRSWKCKYLH